MMKKALKRVTGIGVLAFLALLAVAIIYPNWQCMQASRAVHVSTLMGEGIAAAQMAYYREHGTLSRRFAELSFPEDVNKKLAEIGRAYVVTPKTLSAMQNGGYAAYHKYTLSLDEAGQSCFVLMESDRSLLWELCWVYINCPGQEAYFARKGVDSGDIAAIVADPNLLLEQEALDKADIRRFEFLQPADGND